MTLISCRASPMIWTSANRSVLFQTYRDVPGTGYLRLAANRHFELPFDHVPNFLIRMLMFMDRRPRLKHVVPEGHTLRIKVFPLPAGKPLDGLQLVSVDERHLLISAFALNANINRWPELKLRWHRGWFAAHFPIIILDHPIFQGEQGHLVGLVVQK